MRVVFTDLEEFKKWITAFVREDRHVVYLTKFKEVIIVPRVSTRPIISAYMKVERDEDVTDIIETIPNEVTMFVVKSFDWKDDVPVGVSFLGD